MNYGADTSIVLRVLTGEPSSLAQIVQTRLTALWSQGDRIAICDMVLAEAYFALQHSYGLAKKDALDALKLLAAHPGFSLSASAVSALRTPNLEKASPGFIDRVIHGTYMTDANAESIMLTCEKDAKRLGHVEVLKDVKQTLSAKGTS